MKQWFQKRVINKAIGIANKLVEKKLKGKSLDEIAKITMNYIPAVGTFEMRKRVLASTEDEVKDCIAKGMTDEQILQPCYDSPNYKLLLKKLDLNFDHIKVIIAKARKDNE